VCVLLQESLRQSRMTRFYIKQKEDPHGPHIAIYVSCLPTSLSQRQYEHILLDMIGRENKWSSIDVIYYEYGSLVLVFNNNERASRAFTILQDATFDNKQLLVLLLPNIQVFAAAAFVTLSVCYYLLIINTTF